MGSIKLFLIGILFLFLISSMTKNFFEYRKNYSFYEDYKREYEQEKQKNSSLKTQILKSSDPNQLEKIIRNKLNLLKPNEVSVIIPIPSPTPKLVTPTPAPPYSEWWNVFFKN
jgi:cell division protein FtsB